MIKRIKSRIDSTTTINEKQKLKNIPRGETFEYCGHKWIVLEHDKNNHTLVLSKGIIGKMPFDDNNSNNWAKSSLREYLNNEFLTQICASSRLSDLGFLSITTDLTADDGLDDYGKSIDMVSLLTCDLYRKHREVIELIDEWWWLATPYSTLADHSCYVRYVYMDGVLVSSGSPSGNRGVGVRPICCLSSNLAI